MFYKSKFIILRFKLNSIHNVHNLHDSIIQSHIYTLDTLILRNAFYFSYIFLNIHIYIYIYSYIYLI